MHFCSLRMQLRATMYLGCIYLAEEMVYRTEGKIHVPRPDLPALTATLTSLRQSVTFWSDGGSFDPWTGVSEVS